MLRWCLSTVQRLGGRGSNVSETRPPTVALKTLRDTAPSNSNRAQRRPRDAKRAVAEAGPLIGPYKRVTRRRFFLRHRPSAEAGGAGITPTSEGTEIALHDAGINAERGPKSYVGSPTSIEVLREFLSRTNMTSANPITHTPNTLRSLYMSAFSRSQSRYLDPAMLSSLISLFGALSIPPTHRPHVYINPLTRHVEKSIPFRTYWPFVVRLGMDKTRRCLAFSTSDHYWLMRARLAAVHAEENLAAMSQPSARQMQAISEAHAHYVCLCKSSDELEVHVPFLQGLLAMRTPEHMDDAVKQLASLFLRHRGVHPRLLDVLWKIVLTSASLIPLTSQERILAALWERVVRQSERVTEAGTDNLPRPYVAAPRVEPQVLGTTQLSEKFSGVLFYPPKYSGPSFVNRWAASQVAATFDLTTSTTAARWRSLTLLAMARASPSPPHENNRHSALENSEGAARHITHWEVVLALATLEKTFTSKGITLESQSAYRKGIQTISRDLWYKWTTNLPGGLELRFVARAIVLSFLRLSAIAVDSDMVAACYEYLTSSDLWLADRRDESAQRQVHALAVEYALASAVTGRTWESIISTLTHIWLGPEWRVTITSAVMVRLVRLGALDLAHQFLLFLDDYGIDVPNDTLHTLAIALVSPEYLDPVLPIIRQKRLSAYHTKDLVQKVLSSVAGAQKMRLEPEHAAVLGDAVQELYASSPPSPSYRWCLEHFLTVLAASHPTKAVALMESVHRSSPQYFRDVFFRELLRTLLRRRQFRHAMRLTALAATRPHMGTELRSMLLWGMSQGGAHALARHASRGIPWPGHGELGSRTLMRAVQFKPRLPSAPSVLKVVSMVSRMQPDMASLRLAVDLCIRGGHTSAAKKLLERNQSILDSASRTAVGNMIIHGALLRRKLRNGRQMRKVLREMNMLVKKYGFAADRVTVNILVKGLLRWRRMMDSGKMRALFDHMVRSGYPGGDSGETPFGTPLSAPSQLNLPQLPPHVSFEHHVRPLYKMFIKEFHIRGDHLAANVVVGILKEAGRAALEQREQCARARRDGRSRCAKM
ncbi:hypothetical protein PLICRDRAFT_336441 [Plicaturopsis crispa FD-325 SS-3]|uniref:Uncharacterized protein n=1 Tax=Plicaturopsis crispa FD-325 SS-3 TaxID=944288 RepID=A0A0C9SS33_PLICR|nr:hypothetical protein PLICRDRAFT_336441 [Plicaturopsis crispa FD-325 SS-3]